VVEESIQLGRDGGIPKARFYMTQSAHTHFEHFILRLVTMPIWLKVLLIIMVLGFPFAIAYLEGLPSIPTTQGWRGAVFPIVGIVYVITVTPWIWDSERKVVDGCAPMSEITWLPTTLCPVESGGAVLLATG
jgi:hypothetical protein